ncbi:hypothetical protein EEB14_57470 [Rhodococcus sp. WS4]|nr:hypothetical protein EEB14_57470 [Rhodococcus sp. WS4]
MNSILQRRRRSRLPVLLVLCALTLAISLITMVNSSAAVNPDFAGTLQDFPIDLSVGSAAP